MVEQPSRTAIAATLVAALTQSADFTAAPAAAIAAAPVVARAVVSLLAMADFAAATAADIADRRSPSRYADSGWRRLAASSR